MSLGAYVRSVGILGPGLADWQQAAAVLAGHIPYAPAPTALPMPGLLAPAERRRASRVVKLALAVAAEATRRAELDPAGLPSVFASSGGDGHNCHELCEVLASATRDVSPTRFAHSVHNAAAGYWSIATRAERESSVVCAFDASFCAGLLEALADVTMEARPVLLVAYDTDYPPPLHAKRPVPDAFGVAFALAPGPGPSRPLARIEAEFTSDATDTLRDPGLEALRASIPAARCLPLLERLARGARDPAVLDYLPGLGTRIRIEPCR